MSARNVLNSVGLLIAFLPLLLFAYLGQFSRLISDDYRLLAFARDMGAWEQIQHWRATWTGVYSRFLLYELGALVEPYAPAVSSLATVVIWVAGLALLIRIALQWLQLRRHVLLVSVSLAALGVAAAINALYALSSFYWYSAALAYTAPLALWLVYLAFVAEFARALRRPSAVKVATVVSAAVCFFIAGFSELFLIFQLCNMTFLLLLSYICLSRHGRRIYLQLIGAGWLATLASFAVQVTAPGVALRSAFIGEAISAPAREPWALIMGTANGVLGAIGRQEAFAGFALLFGLGLGATLLEKTLKSRNGTQSIFVLPRRPIWLGLVLQLLFLPLLWTHVSDNTQVLGQFSFAFTAVLLLNLALIANYVAQIMMYSQIRAAIERRQAGLMIYIASVLLLLLLVFAGSQIRSMHFKAELFLYMTAFAQLLILTEQLKRGCADSTARALRFAALSITAMTVVCITVMIGASLFGAGHMQTRSMAPAAFMQVAQGLVWGAYLGSLIAAAFADLTTGAIHSRRMGWASLALVMVVGSGIVIGHARLIPDFRTYAREWDERHNLILSLRDSGQRDIVVSPLTFDLAEYLGEPTMAAGFSNSRAIEYYGLDSISYVDTGA